MTDRSGGIRIRRGARLSGGRAKPSLHQEAVSSESVSAAPRSFRWDIPCVLIVVASLAVTVVLLEVPRQLITTTTFPLPSSTSHAKPSDRNHQFSRHNERFPEYGTVAFTEQCTWPNSYENAAQADQKLKSDCTFYVRPQPGDGQGISQWFSHIVMGYLLARQTNCKFLVDYGPNIDILQVLLPNVGHAANEMHHNWIVPAGFECMAQNRCVDVSSGTYLPKRQSTTMKSTLEEIQNVIGRRKSLAAVPWYRYAHLSFGKGFDFYRFHGGDFRDLERALPGFRIETGMACSLGSLFHLAPNASQFEPQLFSNILPALQDKEALVMALYIRTGHTDVMANAKRRGTIFKEDTEKYHAVAERFLNCALELERQCLSNQTVTEELAVGNFSRIVWMLVTDSKELKHWIVASYNSQDANAQVPVDQRKWPSRVIPRTVFVTGALGVHSRPESGPTTADVASGLIDWYLIGESDLVLSIMTGYSFGPTAALRTARPIYDIKTCSRAVLVEDPLTD